jgi:hypothetical protein
MRIKLSKTDWKSIGQKMGWIKIAQPEDYEPDMMDSAEPPEELDPSFEEDNSDEESSDFSYLTDGHDDDARMVRLRQKAESLAGMHDDSGDVHVALYWLLSDYHGGQNSPEYSALSSSPYSPGPMERGPTGEVKMIYRELKSTLNTK